MIETRKTEIRFKTSDPSKMLNKYLVKDVEQVFGHSFMQKME